MSKLCVLYRDDRLFAVAKPSGMIVHRGWDNDPVTVADRVRAAAGKPVHAIHRLDRGTSGVLMFGLDAETARLMQEEMQSSECTKRYIALVRGPMREACVLDHPVPQRKGGERVPAITSFQPLAHVDRWTLVQAEPQTGRLHQIRRHLKHLSHHVVGDVRYGKGDVNRFFRETYGLNRLALHALKISFRHPDGKQMTITAPIPADLEEPLTKLGIFPSACSLLT